MALHKGLTKNGFKLPRCEKHFHDYDETWVILKGTGNGYWIDPAGQRVDFTLEAGDVWMIPAGYEHGSDGPNGDDFEICVFFGTMPAGSHPGGHYYMETERYLPVLALEKIPMNRYPEGAEPAH